MKKLLLLAIMCVLASNMNAQTSYKGTPVLDHGALIIGNTLVKKDNEADRIAFNNDSTVSYDYGGFYGYIIPENVTKIAKGAFEGFNRTGTSYYYIFIPNHNIEIEEGAFENCDARFYLYKTSESQQVKARPRQDVNEDDNVDSQDVLSVYDYIKGH